ncbi:hypothetical protein C8A05DRAFT_11687 [Staphylotrichum tortipilum]|uniref:2-dehydropantoate 2-reductase n=1 Tax=Staphylotrichum tortipilum TaxID=2831512 RepID=A0AAN6RXK4_9PEZI|nr:hypothetical protein C8A05DRAFT_11687 [Staphylotrichum longicolle]
MVGRGASCPALGRHFTSSTRNATQGYSKYAPWNTAGPLPPHLAGRPGPLAVSFVVNRPAPAEARTSRTKPTPSQYRPAVPADQQTEKDLDRIRSRVALWDADERPTRAPPLLLPQSEVVHVMGLNPAGLYIAHTLAGCETIPPVRFILDKYSYLRRWREARQRLTLYRGDTRIDRLGIMAQYVSEQQAELGGGEFIDNLIVTLPAAQVVKALGLIKHRLNHNSTICLVNDGLGVAEALIETYFPDPFSRPVFLLGHLTTALGYTTSRLAVSEVRAGRLHLSIFSSQGHDVNRPFLIKHHPPLEKTTRATHLIRILAAMPGLHATGHPMPDFLSYKLPKLAFRTIVEPLAALFDCRYDALPKNRHARHLMDQLIGELSSVISRLPECRDSDKLRQFAVVESLRKDSFRKLMLQRTADSPMRAQVTRGWATDLEFLSGYFAKRGREVQASIKALEAVMWSVRAKQNEQLKKLANEIPFETSELVDGHGEARMVSTSEPVEGQGEVGMESTPELVDGQGKVGVVSTAVGRDDAASVHHIVNTGEA